MAIIDYFHFPQAATNGFPRRIAKAAMVRKLDLSSDERRLINNSQLVQSVNIEAELSRNTINVPALVTDTLQLDTIFFVTITTDNNQTEIQHRKIAHLFQKLIPNHLLLCVVSADGEDYSLHLAKKSIPQNGSTHRIVEQAFDTTVLTIADTQNFLSTLRFDHLQKTNMQVLYNAYILLIQTQIVASQTGTFQVMEAAVLYGRMDKLKQLDILQAELKQLQRQYKEATTMNEQIQLNTALHLCKQNIKNLKDQLSN